MDHLVLLAPLVVKDPQVPEDQGVQPAPREREVNLELAENEVPLAQLVARENVESVVPLGK